MRFAALEIEPSNEKGLPLFLGAVFVLSLAVLLYFKASFTVTWDLSHYLSVASNLVHGNGLRDMQFEPDPIRLGFVLFLAAVLKITSFSLQAVALSISLVSALFLVLVYFVGARLGGIRTGLAAATLMAVSPELMESVPRHLDAFWPTPLLGAMLCLLVKPERRHWLWGGLAGFLAALAILIKPVAVLFGVVPLAALLLWREPWMTKRFLSFCIVGILISLTVWTFWAHEISSFHGDVFLYPKSALAQAGPVDDLLILAKFTLTGIYAYFAPTYFSTGLFTRLPVSPFLLLALLAALVYGVYKRHVIILAVVAFIAFLPLNAFVGFYDHRLTQNLFGIAMMFIAGGFALDRLAAHVAGYASLSIKSIPIVSTGIMVVFLAGFGWYDWHFNPRNSSLAFRNSFLSAISRGSLEMDVTLMGSELGAWVRNHVPPDQNLMVDHTAFANGAFITMRASRPVIQMPYFSLSDYLVFRKLEPLNRSLSHPIHIFSTRGHSHHHVIRILDVDHMLRAAREKNATYLAVNTKWPEGLFDSLTKLPMLSQVATVKDTGRVYAVLSISPESPDPDFEIEPLISRESVSYLQWLKEREPERYQWHLQRLLLFAGTKVADRIKTEIK